MEEQYDDLFALQTFGNSIPDLKKVPQSSSVLGSSVKDNQNAKIPEAYAPKSSIPLSPSSKGPSKNNRYPRDVVEDTKLPPISSSISRPRAVLSSPDNDKMIGGMKKEADLQKANCFKEKKLVVPRQKAYLTKEKPRCMKAQL